MNKYCIRCSNLMRPLYADGYVQKGVCYDCNRKEEKKCSNP